MSIVTENHSLVDAIVKAWKTGYTMYFSMFGSVESVDADPSGEKPGLLTAAVKGQTIKNIRWHWPVKPAKDSQCIILFCDNQSSQKFAFGFDLIEEIKTKVGNDIDLHLTAGKIDVTCKEMNININNAKLVSDGTKFNVTGDLNVDGKVKATQNIESNADVVWMAATTPTHGTSHLHPTAAPGAPAPPTPGS